ncbi:hypothetical protein GCM10011404_23980 [Sphingomonas prati]|uniref:Phosphate transporter n=1 Tax=Sphingomonas prati TaxID=1843237 RepID=A0A7W9BTG4_9SPHN|nr:PiT family inorganic phosphate transporter [Sphingomonas prati]GGE90268.1 hypothetical protein GCM10011404_23980 [Sphingomonas prati]
MTAAAPSVIDRVGEAPPRVAMDHKVHPAATIGFLVALLAGLVYAGVSVFLDTQRVGEPLAIGAFLFLGLALLIALGFEFVNGFHDTANAVATVIYTHSLKPVFAVVWSGVWNFIGVIVSTGAVAYSIITLLPVDLILNVGSAGGYAMIFALLIAAVVWNLGTWFMGLPNSSSHALIGSVLGVGVANQWLGSGAAATAGVEWSQAESVLLALLISPVIGFVAAMLLLWAMKRVLPDPKLYEEPKGEQPPPLHIRALLIFTCTAVSFAHGSNDGQKGMGLIMLILIGVAPTAYALNRTMPDSSTPAFIQAASDAQTVFRSKAAGVTMDPPEARTTLQRALRTHQPDTPQVYAALDNVSGQIVGDLRSYGSLRRVPAAETKNVRNEMYLAYDTLRLLNEDKEAAVARFPSGGDKVLTAY